MIRRPPRSTRVRSSAASDVYKRQPVRRVTRTGRLFRFGSYDNKPKPRGPSPVRATTAFKRLIAARGVSVTNVDFGRDQVVVTVRLRSRRLACPLCGFTTKARYDLRRVASSWRHLLS